MGKSGSKKPTTGVTIVGAALIISAGVALARNLQSTYPPHRSGSKAAQPTRSPETSPGILHINDPNCKNSGDYQNNEANHWLVGDLILAGFQHGEALDWVNDHPDAVAAVAHSSVVTIKCNE